MISSGFFSPLARAGWKWNLFKLSTYVDALGDLHNMPSYYHSVKFSFCGSCKLTNLWFNLSQTAEREAKGNFDSSLLHFSLSSPQESFAMKKFEGFLCKISINQSPERFSFLCEFLISQAWTRIQIFLLLWQGRVWLMRGKQQKPIWPISIDGWDWLTISHKFERNLIISDICISTLN